MLLRGEGLQGPGGRFSPWQCPVTPLQRHSRQRLGRMIASGPEPGQVEPFAGQYDFPCDFGKWAEDEGVAGGLLARQDDAIVDAMKFVEGKDVDVEAARRKFATQGGTPVAELNLPDGLNERCKRRIG